MILGISPVISRPSMPTPTSCAQADARIGGYRRLAVAAAVKPAAVKCAAMKCAAMETSVEPDAMSEDEVVEVVKTVPVKEPSSNDNEEITEPVVIRIAISGVMLI
jgi:hypothetical protein